MLIPEGAVVFNPADYCPYSDECLSFQRHSRGKSGNKGVHSHLRKVHPEVTYFLVPCRLSMYLNFGILYIMIGTLQSLVKYEEKHPGTVQNILDGIKSGRLKFCPAESSAIKRLDVERRLRTLFADRRHKDHCKLFLDRSIPQSSRNINCNDVQTLLAGLKDVWSRSPPSTVGVSGKADAIRVRASIYFKKNKSTMINFRLACMQ
jgi:hypothetical protein